MIMSLKFVLGSIFPVCSSTNSIYKVNASLAFTSHTSHFLPFPISLIPTKNLKQRSNHTCRRTRPNTLSISPSGQGNNSGATRSATQARVNSCRSRVSWGTESAETSARRSSMSMVMVTARSKSDYCTCASYASFHGFVVRSISRSLGSIAIARLRGARMWGLPWGRDEDRPLEHARGDWSAGWRSERTDICRYTVALQVRRGGLHSA